MARSKLDTVIYATILLAPLATAIGYIALTPAPEPVIVTIPAQPEAAAPTSTPPTATPPPVAAEPVAARPSVTQPVAEPPAAPAEPPAEAIAAEPPAAPAIIPPPGAAVLVFERQLLLSTAAEPSWATGKLRAHALADGLAASKSVDPTRLPAELQSLVGARFVVHAADGSSCTTEAGALSLHAREYGDIGYFAVDLEYDANDDVLPPSRAQLFEARKAMFAEAHLLFARFAGKTRCNGLWARRADLPAPTVFAAVALDEVATTELKTRVLAVLEAQPAVVGLRASFDAYLAEYLRNNEEPSETTWAEMLASLKVTRWDELGGPRRLVNVELGHGDQGCGDYFTDQVTVMFTLEGDALQPHGDSGFLGPQAIMDLERDGHLEAVTSNGQTIETRGPATAHQAYDFPYNGCGC